MLEATTQFTATAVISAVEIKQSMAAAAPPVAPAPDSNGDDFFDIDLPIPPPSAPASPTHAPDDFGMDEPVIELPEELLMPALPEASEDAGALCEDTIVLPTSPLRTPRKSD
jgi:hypothetical protein